ncbi:MAG: RnfABCDGE type electron transport complex subunit G [Clostridia bacterium]|nr:RnfABCDGE type electron transport complex subunit G [Clostridia bacterium]
MKFDKNEIIKMVKIAVCLLLITAISTALVAVVNEVTKGPIAEQRLAKVNEAMTKVLPAKDYEKLDIADKNLEEIVLEVYAAKDETGNVVGYCVKTAPPGYGGAIEMITGVDMNGVVTGVDIVNMSETAGLGTKTDDEEWLKQYVGKGTDVAVTTSITPAENEVSAVSGATISSKAVTRGVATAITAANQIKGAA